jgi:phospholipase C
MRTLCPAALVILLLAPSAQVSLAAVNVEGNPIQHVVIIVQENHTFDNYFGTFPGANGIKNDPPTAHPYHIWGQINDLCHSTACARADYDNGRMDGFLKSEGSMQTFGYYNSNDIPYYWSLAQSYALFDNYFTSAMGPSLPNHLYLVAGQDDRVADSIVNQGSNLDIGSIAGSLEAARVSWAYYSPYVVGNENALGLISSVAHNPRMMQNLRMTDSFLTDLQSGNMPSVSYIMAGDDYNEHPPADIATGQAWVKSIVGAIQATQYWPSTVVFITWDDYGGWYDHVVPPQVDGHGLGFRVPLLMVSPLARHGYVDHTLSDHTSLMKFVERTFGLLPVTQRDASSSDLMDALNGNYSSRFHDDTFAMQGTPTYSNSAALPALDSKATSSTITFSYLNSQDHAQQAVFAAALRNSRNQTLQVVTTTAALPEGKTALVPLTFKGQAPGTYHIDLMATSPDGTVICVPFRLLLNSIDMSPNHVEPYAASPIS